MSRFTILLAGRMMPTSDLLEAVAGTRVIAADDGIRHARALDCRPELWVGDFDSRPEAPDGMESVPRKTFPVDKDRTDGELAIDEAIARGADDLLLVGALGGPRSDHAFANLVLALRYASQGLAVALFDGHERGWPLGPVPRRFALTAGTQFSILKFGALQGLTIEGAKWPLDHVVVPAHSILTQSNEALGPVTIAVETGEAILLAQADPSIH